MIISQHKILFQTIYNMSIFGKLWHEAIGTVTQNPPLWICLLILSCPRVPNWHSLVLEPWRAIQSISVKKKHVDATSRLRKIMLFGHRTNCSCFCKGIYLSDNFSRFCIHICENLQVPNFGRQSNFWLKIPFSLNFGVENLIPNSIIVSDVL